MTISQRIFFELNKQNKSQKDLSEATGISTSTISAWNKRGTDPPADLIVPIANFLEVSVEYLLLGDAPEDPCTQQHGSGNVVTGDGNITGNTAPVTATITRSEPSEDEMLKEISSILSGLTYRERTELMTAIYKFDDEHKKET